MALTVNLSMNPNNRRCIRHFILFILTLALTSLFHACNTSPRKDASNDKNATPPLAQSQPYALKYMDHPLAYKIWDVKRQQYIDQDALLKQALDSEYLLLGETHDNTYHHQHQAWILDNLAASTKGKNSAVTFEMIDNSQYTKLKDVSLKSSEQLISLLNTEPAGWEYEKYYLPVFNAVIKAGFPVYAGSMGRTEFMDILRRGEDNLPPHLKQTIDAGPLSEEQLKMMRHEIESSHCGMIHDKMVETMLLGQKVRDASMSQSLVSNKSPTTSTMVLVAGSGHVRKDRGVPHYLRIDSASAKITTIAWLEVTPEATRIEDYANYWGAGELPFDYVWFTPMADRPDPCEEMKKYMEKHKNQHQQQNQEQSPPRQQAI